MKKYLILLAVLITPMASANECILLALYADNLRQTAIVDRLIVVPDSERKAYLEKARAEAKEQLAIEKAKCRK